MATKKRRKATKTTTVRKTTKAKLSYADALALLKSENARVAEIGCGTINMVEFIRVIAKLKKDKIPLKNVCFVALNAPFMRRTPNPTV